MKHDVQIDELLSAYLAGDVTPEERAAVERRLADNPALQTQLEELKALVALLRQAQRPVTADMLADIKRRIEAQIGVPISRAVLAQLLSASISGDMTEAERRALDVYLANSPAARAQASSLRELSLFLKKAELRPSANATRRLAERLSAKLPAAALAPVLPVKAPEKAPAKAESVRVHAHANPSNVRIFIAQESPWPRRVFKTTAAVAAAIALSAGAIFGLRAMSRPGSAGSEVANLGQNQTGPSNDPSRQAPTVDGGTTTRVDGTAASPERIQTATSTDTATLPMVPPKPVDGGLNSPPSPVNPVEVIDGGSDHAPRSIHTTTPLKSRNQTFDPTQPTLPTVTPNDTTNDPPESTHAPRTINNGNGGVIGPVTGLGTGLAQPTPGPTTNTTQAATNTAISTSVATGTGTGTGTGATVVQGSVPPTTGKPTSTSTNTSPISSTTTAAVQSPIPPKDGMLAALVYGSPQSAGQTLTQQQTVPSGTQIVTDGNSRVAFVLPGNGRLWVNHNTSITVKLSNMNTIITLDSGEIGYRTPQTGSGNLTVNHASGVQIATVNGLADINNDTAANTIVTSVVLKSATVVHKNKSRTPVKADEQVTIDLATDIASPTVALNNVDPGQWHADMLIPGDQPDGTPLIPFDKKTGDTTKKRNKK